MNKLPIAFGVAILLIAVVGLSGCTYENYIELSVIVIDDTVPEEYEEYYENIPGEPTTIGVYLCRQDETFTYSYHFDFIDNISLEHSEGNNYTGSKIITWAGNETLCVGYSRTRIDELSMITPKCLTSTDQDRKCNATVHHWKYIGPLPVG